MDLQTSLYNPGAFTYLALGSSLAGFSVLGFAGANGQVRDRLPPPFQGPSCIYAVATSEPYQQRRVKPAAAKSAPVTCLLYSEPNQ